MLYNPVLDRAAVPKMRLTKSELTTRTHAADLMALLVEWVLGVPDVGIPPPVPVRSPRYGPILR